MLARNVGYDDWVRRPAATDAIATPPMQPDKHDHAQVAAPAAAERRPEPVPRDAQNLPHMTASPHDARPTLTPRSLSLPYRKSSRWLAALARLVLPPRRRPTPPRDCRQHEATRAPIFCALPANGSCRGRYDAALPSWPPAAQAESVALDRVTGRGRPDPVDLRAAAGVVGASVSHAVRRQRACPGYELRCSVADRRGLRSALKVASEQRDSA